MLAFGVICQNNKSKKENQWIKFKFLNTVHKACYDLALFISLALSCVSLGLVQALCLIVQIVLTFQAWPHQEIFLLSLSIQVGFGFAHFTISQHPVDSLSDCLPRCSAFAVFLCDSSIRL